MKRAAPYGGAARGAKQGDKNFSQDSISLAPPPPFRIIGEAVGTILVRLLDEKEAHDVARLER